MNDVSDQGVFIVVEGPEGAGKSTQCRRLRDNLVNAGYDVVLTFEPGDTPAGAQIRSLLLDPDPALVMDPVTESRLFSADRRLHCQQVIIPALAAGKVVISDRYFFSTLAYQCYAGDVPMSVVETLTAYATEGLMPDLLLVLDGDPVKLFCRKDGDCPDRFEGRNIAFHNTLRAGFLDLVQKHADISLVVNALQDEGVIEEIIWQEAVTRLNL